MRRALAMTVFGVLGVGFLLATHRYLALRLVIDPGLPPAATNLGVALISLCAASLVAQPFAERMLRPSQARWIAWPASIWMGAAFWLLLMMMTTDLFLSVVGGVARAATMDGSDPLGASSGWRAAIVASVALFAVGFGMRSAFSPPRLRREVFEIAGWPEGFEDFRIVQLSDIHIGPLLKRDFARSLVERVNALDPDLIAITGDLVDGRVHLLADEVAPFADLRARHGVFFVTGNHDHFSGAPSWVEKVRELGMRPLRNERVEIRSDVGCVFDLVGVDDHHAHFVGDGREDLAAALAQRDPERPAVLLAHDPGTFQRARREAIDLQLSGHTHGGQIWPFHWFVRLATPWVAGRYREGRAQLYVSRGCGFWGPPMRLGSPAEIAELVLRAPAARAATPGTSNARGPE